ncbi:MAG TPA: VWA domain-containing protein, partial [Planctomycetota bacterium]|nr:VWA domain-containing protein [Planctomycetota bacterium]
LYLKAIELSFLFFQANTIPNIMEPVAKSIANFLSNFSGDGSVQLICWACSQDGSGVEEIGSFNPSTLQNLSIQGPKKLPWGRGTQLLPALKYFLDDKMLQSPWSLIIFITDGILEDLDTVKEYCQQIGQDMASGKRESIKLVLLGVGEEVDEAQMQELDDMFEGTGLKDIHGNEIDLWCHKLASNMTRMEEVFAEVVSENTMIGPKGQVLDDKGNLLCNYSDGLPAKLRFNMPKTSQAFTLSYPGGSVTQSIVDAIS